MFTLKPGAAILAATALTVAATAVPDAASAQRYDGGGRYDQAYGDAYRDGYNRAPQYRGAHRGYDGRERGDDRRRCNDGTAGTIIGAIAGGLLGRSIDTHGDRSLGTILGAGGGALAGRAVGRSGNPGRCR